MKETLLKHIIRYAKTKGRVPLDERQMDLLKDQYMELAKSAILGFFIFTIAYGYMEVYGQEVNFSFFNLSLCMIGGITFYYLLRFCYLQIIGIDVNFETLIVPALVCTPFIYTNALAAIGMFFKAPRDFYLAVTFAWPLFIILNYAGANRVFQNGKVLQERAIERGEQHFRTRKQFINYFLVCFILLMVLPIRFQLVFSICLIAGAVLMVFFIWYYGFHTPRNEYILDEEGLRFHKALWNKKGEFLKYEEIESVQQQDTFNIGYAKDKVCIQLKDGRKILLYPENSYRFCIELENNLY